MTDANPVEVLLDQMEAAAERGDFAEVTRLRQALDDLRPSTPGPRLGRPDPGEMGADPNQGGQIGRPGWTPPDRPDSLTANVKRGGRRSR